MNIDKLNLIFEKYKIDKKDQDKIFNIIKNIFLHKEFQRRLTSEFLHHGNITLGEHILEDTVVTFLYYKKHKNFNLEYALKISMMHDLYTAPWQNSGIKKKNLFYKHGFRHPIEAAINSVNWFKDEFNDKQKSKIIIDGIIHHMFPLPVMSLNEKNKIELLNYKLLDSISDYNRNLIFKSSNRNKIGKVSVSKSLYKEGRIVMHVDKKVSMTQIKTFHDALALLTGKNKSLITKK